VLCEYSKFQIESNSYFSIWFDLKWAQLFKIFEYLPSLISCIFNKMTTIFHLSNHTYQPTKSVVNNGQGPVSPWSLYIGPLWPTKYWNSYNLCHKNSWLYLTSTYYWWLLRPMITIRLDSKFQIIAQLFDSIRNETKTLFAQH